MLGLLTVLAIVCSHALACGDDRASKVDDESSDQPRCDELTRTLCARTAECAEQEGFSAPSDHAQFLTQCLRGIERGLSCTEPSSIGDVYLDCQDSLRDLPCDRVVEQLRADMMLLAPLSCGEFFAL